MDSEHEQLLQSITELLRSRPDQIDTLRLVIHSIAVRVRTDPGWLDTLTPDTTELVRRVLEASVEFGGPELKNVVVH